MFFGAPVLTTNADVAKMYVEVLIQLAVIIGQIAESIAHAGFVLRSG